jgi:hypothetical protein
VAVAAILSAPLAAAQTAERRIGLLEWPALREHIAAGKKAEEFSLFLYTDAGRGAKTWREQGGKLIMKEHGYEELSLVVMERRTVAGQRWARIALANGRGWLPEPTSAVFRAYADLVKESLAYLTEAWEGRVWDAPGGTAKVVPFRQIERPEHAADVLEYREVNGQLWLRVNIFSESPCEQQQPLSLIEGWIPAYNARGQWTADFYSRGC